MFQITSAPSHTELQNCFIDLRLDINKNNTLNLSWSLFQSD